MKDNNTVIVFLNKPQGVTQNLADSHKLFQEYFRGKNYEIIERKEQIMQKIRDIKEKVDKLSSQNFMQQQ